MIVDGKCAHAVRRLIDIEDPRGDDAKVVNDHAGPTKYGITLKLLQKMGLLEYDLNLDGLLTLEDLRKMGYDHAMTFYAKHWFIRYRMDEIHDWDVSAKTFDMYAHAGPHQATLNIQRAIRGLGIRGVEEDGLFGGITREAVNVSAPTRLLPAIRCECAGFYRRIIRVNTHLEIYKNGWMRRAYDEI